MKAFAEGYLRVFNCPALLQTDTFFFFFSLFLAVLGLHRCMGSSWASGGYSLAMVLESLTAVASLGEHRIQGARASGVAAPEL